MERGLTIINATAFVFELLPWKSFDKLIYLVK